MNKGMSTISEILFAFGAILAAAVFFLVGSEMIGFQISQFYSSSESRVLKDITNRIHSSQGQEGVTKVEFDMPIDVYTLKARHSTLTLDTPDEETEKSRIYGMQILSNTVEDEETICFTITEDSLLEMKAGSCEDLDPGRNFCAGGRCINGECQPEYGETCESPDCDCETFCCPEESDDFVDEKGCLLEEYIGEKEGGDRCGCDAVCSEGLECNPTTSNFTEYSKACCPGNKSFDGENCKSTDKLTILFVPLNSKSNFDSASSSHGDKFVESYPSKDCPSIVNIEKSDQVCDVSVTSSSCSQSDMMDTLQEIVQCTQSTGETDYDYVVGIFSNEVCTEGSSEGIEGWSDGPGGLPSVAVEYERPKVTPHELGHEFGLNDEYIDSCNCQSVGGAVDPVDSNCLDPDLSGDDPAQGFSSSHCTGGSCPSEYEVTCLGNKNPEGGRCIMSFAGAPGPREFCERCMDYLSDIEDLKCP